MVDCLEMHGDGYKKVFMCCMTVSDMGFGTNALHVPCLV